MPNPTLTPTITALARELAERVQAMLLFCGCCNGRKCMYCLSKDLESALASPPVEAAQGEPTVLIHWAKNGDVDHAACGSDSDEVTRERFRVTCYRCAVLAAPEARR